MASLQVRTVRDSQEFSEIPVLVEHKIFEDYVTNILQKTGIIKDKNEVAYYPMLKNSKKILIYWDAAKVFENETK